jgi:hypothetical protein
MPIVALAEPVSLIERRIAEITRVTPRLSLVRALAAGVLAAAVIVVACAAPPPATRATFVVAPPTAEPIVHADSSIIRQAVPVQPPRTIDSRMASTPATTGITRTDARTDTTPLAAQIIAPVAPTVTVDSARAATLALQPRTGRGAGFGDPTQTIEAVYRVLFDGISLDDDQRSRATEILGRLAAEQSAQMQATITTVQASMPKRAAIQAWRDSSLRALVSSPVDRAIFDEHAATPAGGRGGGVPPGAGGRSGGPGRGPSEVVIDAMYHRLFDGITMSPDNEAAAHGIIQTAQTELAALLPPPQPPRLQLRPQLGVVVMRPDGESALESLLTSDADRATLRARISTTPIGDLPRQP